MAHDDVRYVRAISPSEPSLAPAPRYWNIGRDSLYNGGLRASWRRHDRDRRQSLFEQVRTTASVQWCDLSFGTLRDMCGTAVLRMNDKIMTDWKYASPFCIDIKRREREGRLRWSNERCTRARYKFFFSSYEWRSYVEFISLPLAPFTTYCLVIYNRRSLGGMLKGIDFTSAESASPLERYNLPSKHRLLLLIDRLSVQVSSTSRIRFRYI